MFSPRPYQRTVSDSHRLNKFKLSLAKRTPSNEDPSNPSKHRPNLPINRSLQRLHTQRTIKQPFYRHQQPYHTTKRDKHSRQQSHLFNQDIHVTLTTEHQRIEFKSRASTVKNLVEEARSALRNYTAKTHPLAFETCNNDLALDYHLSCPNATTHFLFGQSISLRPYPTSPNTCPLTHFQLKRPIGSGGFSRVFLSRDRSDGRFYALKVISKAFIVKHKKQQLITNERDIMVELPHPLLAQLQATFETKQFIVFVMDYYPGGELFGVVKRFRKMNETMARFYTTEILLGLERLHDAGVAYRDLKPENVLLDREGHVHLADFGLAKPGLRNQHSRAYSFCGSAEYMPPEIVSKRGHALPADFYSLGALLFELVTGLPPFYDRDPQKIYKATRCKQITVPDYVSKSLVNLLEGLLTKEEDKRLGARFGVREILAHPWFGKIERTDFIEKRTTPPVSFLLPGQYHLNGGEANAQNDSFIEELTRELADRGHFAPMFPNFAYSQSFIPHSTERRHLRSRQFSKSKRKTLLTNCLSTGRMPQSNNYI